ncbi:hypothetical protein K431DRAFT_141107 [Polychaeton citri CBS 116435]|uniref:Rho-GAP domain-containing protein n=1 Tax=Polychaeton citri CBS 116435 TaxID=1314669 RepID=A0A9P4UMM0_9PEZI|nr:hypothetical protein K431DRAFT_141107 [Polychaeton citri CBS 116435]
MYDLFVRFHAPSSRARASLHSHMLARWLPRSTRHALVFLYRHLNRISRLILNAVCLTHIGETSPFAVFPPKYMLPL